MTADTHDINEIKRRMQGALQVLKTELSGLRTGRASAHLLDPVQVDVPNRKLQALIRLDDREAWAGHFTCMPERLEQAADQGRLAG